MSKSLQYVKVFELLQNAKGPVNASEVKGLSGIVPTRLSTYLWEIKKNTGFAVKSNRDGRTVVSYELVGSGTAPVAKTPKAPKAPKTPKAPKAPKTPKAPKAPKTPKAPKVPKTEVPKDEVDFEVEQEVLPTARMIKNSNIFDALDEIDSDVVDFEDREFAAEYARGV